ncbi:transglutaminaseTgpA domain-containing protein [Thioalkalivibrio sp.]|uniref:transglutaminase family protein n=1 Tax=Thioalkalivibrio sp. TaxID=2093813 RepID=UPI003975764B
MGLLTRTWARPPELLGLWLLLAAVPVAALPHAWEQPPWVFAVLMAAWLWRLLIHLGNARLPARWLMVLLVLGGVALTLAEYRTVFGQQAGTALLLVMLALKLLEIRTQRDIVVSLFLAYFVIITTYFFNQSILIAGYSLLSAWLITAALIQVHGGRVLPFARLARASGLMMLHALPIMLILFLVFPRIPGPIWGSPHDTPTGQTGLSDRLEPGDIAQLLENEATALRVRFDGPVPASSQQYWRALVMTDFDGRGWRVDRGRPEVPTDGAAPGDVAYTATLEPTRARYLPVLDFPVGIPGQARLLDNLQVVTPRRIDSRMQYSGHARLDAPPAWPLSAEERARALALPADAAPRARLQAGLWRAAHGSDDHAIVREALRLFAQEPFRYTLRPPLLRGDRTDAFLFESRAGYCEHYASTLAVLMRAAGIPARVITGYQGGQWMEAGDYLRLRQADAHAWTEVWLEDRGWTRVDPTAAIAPERIETGLSGWFGEDADAPAFLRRSGLPWTVQWRLRLSDWHDLMTFRWESMVLAFDPERQRELFARFGLDATDWRSVLIALGGSLGGLALLAGLLALLRRPRDGRDPAQRALDRLSRRMRRHQLAREPHETVAAYAARVSAARPDLAHPLADFARAYTHLRYAELDTQQREDFQRQLWRALGEAKT